MDLWRGIQAIKNRKGLFLATFLVALLAVILVPRGNVEVKYESAAKILLTPPSGLEQNRYNNTPWFANELTLKELVTSEKLLRRVARRMDQEDTWADLKDQIEFRQPEQVGGFVRYNSTVTLFYLVAESPQAELSQEIASNLVDEFVSYVQELSAQEFANTRRYLEELVAEAREKVEEAEEHLLALTADKRTSDSDELLENESSLEKERLTLKEAIATLESETGLIDSFLSGGSSAAPWSVISERGQMLDKLEQAVSEQRLKLLELQEIYTDESRQIQEQKTKLAKVESLYQNQRDSLVTSLYDQKNSALQDKRDQLGLVTQQLLELRKTRLTPEERRDVTSLERQLAMWEENHLSLVKQLYQARVLEQSARRQGSIQILEKPGPGRVPQSSTTTSLIKSLAVGVPFSLLVAIGVLLGVEYWSTSLQFVPQVEQILELPVMVAIPKVPVDLANEWEAIKTQQAQIGAR